MTYPQQQYQQQYLVPPQTPQQHAQPQYGAPQGTPWMPPQYGGAPAQQPVGGQGLPTNPPPLGQSARTGEGGPKAPQPRHLIGRTVIFEPVSINEEATAEVFNQATRQTETVKRPMATYHLTVVDGGPLQYGDNKSQKIDEQHGMTLETQVPARFLNCQSDRWGIVQEIRDAMARGDMASVGVIVQGTKGTKGSPPFLVTKVHTDLEGKARPDGDERFAAATQVWNAIFSKTFTSPEPRSLVAPPPAAAPQVQYQPTAPAMGTYAYHNPVPPHLAGPAGPPQPEYVAAPTQPAYAGAAHYPVPGGTAADWAASPYQQQPSALAAAMQQSAPPVNSAFEAWLATLPPEQQAAQRAALAGQAPVPQGPGI